MRAKNLARNSNKINKIKISVNSFSPSGKSNVDGSTGPWLDLTGAWDPRILSIPASKHKDLLIAVNFEKQESLVLTNYWWLVRREYSWLLKTQSAKFWSNFHFRWKGWGYSWLLKNRVFLAKWTKNSESLACSCIADSLTHTTYTPIYQWRIHG